MFTSILMLNQLLEQLVVFLLYQKLRLFAHDVTTCRHHGRMPLAMLQRQSWRVTDARKDNPFYINTYRSMTDSWQRYAMAGLPIPSLVAGAGCGSPAARAITAWRPHLYNKKTTARSGYDSQFCVEPTHQPVSLVARGMGSPAIGMSLCANGARSFAFAWQAFLRSMSRSSPLTISTTHQEMHNVVSVAGPKQLPGCLDLLRARSPLQQGWPDISET